MSFHETRLNSELDKARQSLIRSARQACVSPGPNPEQDRQCRRQAMPSYINLSMSLPNFKERVLPVLYQLKKLKQSLRASAYPKSEKEYKEEYNLLEYLWHDYKIEIIDKRQRLESDIAHIADPVERNIYQKIDRDIADLQEKINNWSLETDPSYTIFESLAQNGSLIIMSAGNKAPSKPVGQIKSALSRNLDIALVGSLEPDGRPSGFSSRGKEVAIMAPAGQYIHSADQQESPKPFGGTSAAAPLVTGALAGFEWLSGHRPTASQAKSLLEKTAIPLLSSNDRPRENGAGLLNAYKLGMVGARLKEICGQDPDCFQREIQKPETYQFPEDEGLGLLIEQTFPDCSFACGGTKDTSCENQDKAFQRLRRAVLLNPHNRRLHIQLACIYKMQGFEDAFHHHLNIVKALDGSDSRKESQAVCQSDADCVLVKDCSRMSRISPFKAMTREQADIHYTLHCRKSCNGKCDCGNKERSGHSVYFARCVRSQCSLQTESAGGHSAPDSQAPESDSSQEPSATGETGQR